MRGLVALLFVALALAGCSGGGAPDDQLKLADGTTIDVDGGTSDTTGAIAGVVVDEAIRPVVGAVLTTTDGAHGATTDANGVFLVGDLAPGFYALLVKATDHLEVQTSAEVVAGEVAKVRVQMVRDVRPTPYLQTYPYTAYMQGWATIGQFAVEVVADSFLNDTTLCDCGYTFTPGPNVTAIILEAFWDAAAPDPATLAEYYWEVGDPSGDWYETGYCTSPCRVEVPMADFRDGMTVEVRMTGPDAWVAVQQQVRIFTTVFHYGEAPEGWTIQGV